MFDHNGRVEKNEYGCRFYDQDIIFMDYDYTGDCTIDLDVTYQSPGFGILLVENDTSSIFTSGYSALYRIGDATYSVEEYIDGIQKHVTDGVFRAIPDGTKIHLTLYKNNNVLWMTQTYVDSNGETQIFGGQNLTYATLSETIDTYRIGFYSNAGNTMQCVSIANGMPKGWVVNIKNTNGGRVSFITDGFVIQDCEYNADVSQQNIELKAGTYYLSCDISGDIEAFVIPSNQRATKQTISDTSKTILQNDGSFTLDADKSVNVVFSGRNGSVKNICIKTVKNGVYISTTEDGETIKQGSYIVIDLAKIKSIEWTGIITAVPEHKLTETPSYSIFNADGEEPKTIDDVQLKLNTEYTYQYSKTTRRIVVNGNIFEVPLTATKLYIFKNINATISKFVVTDIQDKENDILNSDTYKLYISNTIRTPIIVADENDEPYDLSSSYREVILSKTKLELFNQYVPINLSERIDTFHNAIHVYGVPDSATIIKSADTIEKYASTYLEISPAKYIVDYAFNSVTVDAVVRQTYKYIIVQYESADLYRYVFTNWERELFDVKNGKTLTIEHDMNPSIGKLIVYGIKNDEKVHVDCLYRVPSESMIHSVDYFANRYDTISSDAYTINYKKRRLFIVDSVINKYQYIVIDYLKENSYVVNDVSSIGEYEIDISSSSDSSKVLYDIAQDGTISNYIITEIKPNQDRYIVLSKGEES